MEANVSQQPYIYFPQPSTIRKTSQKIPHFLAIVDVYKQLLQYEKPKLFKVEPKYNKTYMEPDVFTIWRQSPFFIEVQNSVYSKKVMQEKGNRYEFYFHSSEWQQEQWQPKKSKYFPSQLIITDTQYDIYSPDFRIFQTKSIHDFMNQMAIRN
ncbi:hypothetical protein CN553_20905 [Bacillus cereus]|uniref:Uncharacterized protein n=1 Tax=Bacillus cereus TaxID=1396 RepID=A0A9X6YL18_BACCE|nr:hypothetical protein CN553_20905 [Bacillus cereus]